MKIAFIDVCNTLADVNGAVKKRGYDPAGHKLAADLSIWLDDSLYREAEPHPKPIRRVLQLKDEGYKIIYLTARPLPIIPVTIWYLGRHGLPEADVLCSAHTNKGDYITQYLQANPAEEVLIMDDSPKELESIIRCSPSWDIPVKLIIPRHEYNMQFQCDEEIILFGERVANEI